MNERTKIEWCDYTFNPWTGCTKVSAACDHCYAESWSKRSGHVEWGPHAPRRRTTPANWRKPLKWNTEAARDGVRRRVFCASLADVFDNHGSITSGWRGDLWHLIAKTPLLDWLLLTKRPQNIAKMLPDGYGAPAWGKGWPNVWLGTTVENQEEADRRIPHLLSVPAVCHFVSCEPLLGPVDLQTMPFQDGDPRHKWDALTGQALMYGDGVSGNPDIVVRIDEPLFRALKWVIVGNESGPGWRDCDLVHHRSLLAQCRAAGVAYFEKQLGGTRDKRDRLEDLPPDLRVREWPDVGVC